MDKLGAVPEDQQYLLRLRITVDLAVGLPMCWGKNRWYTVMVHLDIETVWFHGAFYAFPLRSDYVLFVKADCFASITCKGWIFYWHIGVVLYWVISHDCNWDQTSSSAEAEFPDPCRCCSQSWNLPCTVHEVGPLQFCLFWNASWTGHTMETNCCHIVCILLNFFY